MDLSVKYNDDLICHSQEGQCNEFTSTLLSTSPGDNDFECFVKCLATDNCSYYTWYDSNAIVNPTYMDMCYFYSECNNIQQGCAQGCVVGNVFIV